jgi:hypothetical protein
MGKDDVEARMQALLDSLQYNFESFTIEGFVEWVARRRGRPIAFVPRALPSKVFGAWVKGEGVSVGALLEIVPTAVVFGADLQGDGVDVVFYEIDTPAVHRGHNQIHEIGHIICDHPTASVGAEQVEPLLRSVGTVDRADLESLLLRSAHSDEHEQEAETIASFIRVEAIRHNRLKELTTAIPVNEVLANYLEALEI